MACAAALQGGWAQRGFLRTVEVGVDVPDAAVVVVGVAVPDVGVSVPAASAGLLSVMRASPISVGAVPPRSGERSSRVVAGCRLSDDTVSEEGRCRPARSRRTSDGRFAEAERKSRTSEMEFAGRTFRGMAVKIALSVVVSYVMVRFMAWLTLSTTDLDEDLDVVGWQRRSRRRRG